MTDLAVREAQRSDLNVRSTESLVERLADKYRDRITGYFRQAASPAIHAAFPDELSAATRLALQKAGLSLNEIDLIEVNEAFAAQYLAVEKELGLDRNRTNVNGGAIALGHPLGATGTRLVLTVLHELHRRNKRYGLATACIGGGQGIAMIVEKL